MREAATCPPRETTVTGDQSNTTTLTVASTAPFRVGYTLTIPQTNATGTITTTTRVITNIAGNTLTLATAVATTAGQRVANGAVVNLVCGTANPTPYAEWPDPATGERSRKLAPAAPRAAGSTFGAGGRHDGDADRRRQRRRHDADERGDVARTACSTSPTR